MRHSSPQVAPKFVLGIARLQARIQHVQLGFGGGLIVLCAAVFHWIRSDHARGQHCLGPRAFALKKLGHRPCAPQMQAQFVLGVPPAGQGAMVWRASLVVAWGVSCQPRFDDRWCSE